MAIESMPSSGGVMASKVAQLGQGYATGGPAGVLGALHPDSAFGRAMKIYGMAKGLSGDAQLAKDTEFADNVDSLADQTMNSFDPQQIGSQYQTQNFDLGTDPSMPGSSPMSQNPMQRRMSLLSGSR